MDVPQPRLHSTHQRDDRFSDIVQKKSDDVNLSIALERTSAACEAVIASSTELAASHSSIDAKFATNVYSDAGVKRTHGIVKKVPGASDAAKRKVTVTKESATERRSAQLLNDTAVTQTRIHPRVHIMRVGAYTRIQRARACPRRSYCK